MNRTNKLYWIIMSHRRNSTILSYSKGISPEDSFLSHGIKFDCHRILIDRVHSPKNLSDIRIDIMNDYSIIQIIHNRSDLLCLLDKSIDQEKNRIIVSRYNCIGKLYILRIILIHKFDFCNGINIQRGLKRHKSNQISKGISILRSKKTNDTISGILIRSSSKLS